MKERPILFQGAMVRALLNGSKTQTRRLVKSFALEWLTMQNGFNAEFVALPENRLCPYGVPGDRLWVRESLGYDAEYGHYFAADRTFLCSLFDDEEKQAGYSYDGNGPAPRSVPSIHLPRRYSRITLEITDVRVERLQDISEADAIAEGIEHNTALDPAGTCHWRRYDTGGGTNLPESSYESLWKSINGAGSWAANPWVWSIHFKVAQ